MESRGKEAKGHGTGVVIETSALISFLLSKQPERNAVGFLLRLVKDGTLINYTSMEALEEIRTKLAHPKIQSLYGKVVSDQRRKKDSTGPSKSRCSAEVRGRVQRPC